MTGPIASAQPVGGMYAHRRWIPAHKVEHARQAAELLREHGAITGETVYDRQHQARWQAQWLRTLLVDCREFARPELVEHNERKHGGWIWSLEYKRGPTSYGR